MSILPTQLPDRGEPGPGENLNPGARAPRNWAVIGGGITGMTLALRLRQMGHRVTLFEAGAHLGGLADAWQLGDITWDRHYHVTLLSDAHLLGLLGELGIREDMVWSETKTGFYTGGEWYGMSNSLEFLRFPPLGLLDKLRLGGTIFLASKLQDWKRLEKIPVEDWLRRWSGDRTFEKIWLPLLQAKLGENYRKASAAFIWAIIARMYAARRSGLKKEMFGYLEGGYHHFLGAFTRHLARAGVTVRTHAPIHGVRSAPDGRLTVKTVSGERQTFDRVAVTLPSPVAARLCPEISPVEREKHAGISYQGIVCASALLRKPLRGYYVSNITDPAPFTAIIEMTALVDPANFGGKTLIYLPKYVDPSDPIFERDSESIIGEFRSALLRMHPHLTADDIVTWRVSRVRNVLALSTLGYSESLPPMDTSVPGLHIVNSAHIVNGTLNVNECVHLANRVAARLEIAAVPDA